MERLDSVMQATLAQQFETESIKRQIDSTTDVAELQQIARHLADLYLKQRVATAWIIANKWRTDFSAWIIKYCSDYIAIGAS